MLGPHPLTIPTTAAIKCHRTYLTNHIGFILHYITPRVINSLQGRHSYVHKYTCTHTDICTEIILKNQVCACHKQAHTWLKNFVTILQPTIYTYVYNTHMYVVICMHTYMEGHLLSMFACILSVFLQYVATYVRICTYIIIIVHIRTYAKILIHYFTNQVF